MTTHEIHPIMRTVKKHYNKLFELYMQLLSESESYPILDKGALVNFVESTKFADPDYLKWDTYDRSKFLRFLIMVWKKDHSAGTWSHYDIERSLDNFIQNHVLVHIPVDKCFENEPLI